MRPSVFTPCALAIGLLCTSVSHAGFVTSSSSDPNFGPPPPLYVPPNIATPCQSLALGAAFVNCAVDGRLSDESATGWAAPKAAAVANVTTSLFGTGSLWSGPLRLYVGEAGEQYGAGAAPLVSFSYGTTLVGGLPVTDNEQVVLDILQDLDEPFVLVFGGSSYATHTYFYFDPAGGLAAGTQLLFNSHDHYQWLGGQHFAITTAQLWLPTTDAGGAVPEPQTLALVAAALAVLAFSRRR